MFVQVLRSVKIYNARQRLPLFLSTGLYLAVHLLSLGLGLRAQQQGDAGTNSEARGTGKGGETQAWKEAPGDGLLCVSPDRLILSQPGSVQVFGLEHEDPDSWTVRNQGHLETWKV